jgi:hypothetical protein
LALRAPDWTGIERLRVEPLLTDPRSVWYSGWGVQEVGFAESGPAKFDVGVLLSKAHGDRWKWTGRVEVPVEMVPGPVFKPRPDLTEEVGRAVKVHIRGYSGSSATHTIVIELDRAAAPLLARVGIGISAVYLCRDTGEQVHCTTYPRNIALDDPVWRWRGSVNWSDFTIGVALTEEELSHWTIEYRGMRDEALACWLDLPEYWDGVVRVPAASVYEGHLADAVDLAPRTRYAPLK